MNKRQASYLESHIRVNGHTHTLPVLASPNDPERAKRYKRLLTSEEINWASKAGAVTVSTVRVETNQEIISEYLSLLPDHLIEAVIMSQKQFEAFNKLDQVDIQTLLRFLESEVETLIHNSKNAKDERARRLFKNARYELRKLVKK